MKKIFKIPLLLFFVFVIILIVIPIFKVRKQTKIEKIKQMELYQLIEKEKQKKAKLEEDIKSANSHENIEKIAREKLNMKKEGERVYKIVEEENKSEGE